MADNLSELFAATTRAGVRVGMLGQRAEGLWSCTLYRGIACEIAGASYGQATAEQAISVALGKSLPPAPAVLPPPPPV